MVHAGYMCVCLFFLVSCVAAAGCLGSGNSADDLQTADMQKTLQVLSGKIGAELETTARDLINVADNLSPMSVSLDSAEAKTELETYYQEHPWAIDILAVNDRLMVVNAVPASRETAIGSDMSGYTQDRESLRAGNLHMAAVFQLEEGSTGSALSYPIPAENDSVYEDSLGGAKGYVATAFLPAKLIDDAASDVLAGSPYVIRVVQPDGTLIYDRDAYQLHKNVTGELPPEVLTTESGTLKNTVRVNETEKTRIVVWDTLAVGETAWRIVVLSF